MMNQIVSKLKTLLKERFPELLNSLNPPAKDSEIKMAEEKVGKKFPKELKELYKQFNGESGEIGFFFGLQFLSIEEMLNEWTVWSQVAEEDESSLDVDICSEPEDHIKENYANKYYLPIAHDFSGNHIGIDLDPGKKGQYWQVINFGRDEEDRFVLADTITEFFNFIKEVVKSHNFSIVSSEDSTNWYYVGPNDQTLTDNKYFFDAIPQLNLPLGKPKPPINSPDKKFNVWYNSLDENWQEIVENQVRGKLSFSSVEKTRSLILIRKEITDSSLKAISKFKGLKEAILTGNPISDFTPLLELENLKKLYLAGTKIKDVKQIVKLIGLTKLGLTYLKNINISGLSEMKKLKYLSLGSTNLKTLEEVGKIKSLSDLDISDNQFDSFEPLANLKNMLEIDLSRTNISDLNFLVNYKKLKSLNISSTEISNFTPLQGLEKLDYVTCSYGDFEKIKILFDRKLSFTISGKTTDKQYEKYSKYQTS